MNVEIFQQYAELKVQEKEIKEKIDGLKESVIKEMTDVGLDKQPTPLGTFTIQLSKKWTFSKVVKEAEDYAQDLKEGEKANGTATYKEVPELKFFQLKSSE